MGTVVMVTSRKGGTAKSTLCWNLAALSGAHVLDTDPQGTLREIASDIDVIASPGAGAIADLQAVDKRQPLLLVDTAPSLDARTLALMDHADYFLVPTGANEMGLQASRLTLQEIARKGRLEDALVVFTLTAARPDMNFVRGVSEAFRAGGVSVARTLITRRAEVEVAPSYGLSVVKHKPKGKSVNEHLALWQELQTHWKIKHAKAA
jgi:cellulose biosynthesis protein BcsQ